MVNMVKLFQLVIALTDGLRTKVSLPFFGKHADNIINYNGSPFPTILFNSINHGLAKRLDFTMVVVVMVVVRIIDFKIY